MIKLNCWEITHCGRQPGGDKIDEFGICPTAIDKSSNGINNGKNAGRYCWRIANTLCEGKRQRNYATKALNCVKCEFF